MPTDRGEKSLCPPAPRGSDASRRRPRAPRARCGSTTAAVPPPGSRVGVPEVVLSLQGRGRGGNPTGIRSPVGPNTRGGPQGGGEWGGGSPGSARMGRKLEAPGRFYFYFFKIATEKKIINNDNKASPTSAGVSAPRCAPILLFSNVRRLGARGSCLGAHRGMGTGCAQPPPPKKKKKSPPRGDSGDNGRGETALVLRRGESWRPRGGRGRAGRGAPHRAPHPRAVGAPPAAAQGRIRGGPRAECPQRGRSPAPCRTARRARAARGTRGSLTGTRGTWGAGEGPPRGCAGRGEGSRLLGTPSRLSTRSQPLTSSFSFYFLFFFFFCPQISPSPPR